MASVHDQIVKDFRAFQASSGKKRIDLAEEIGISEPALNRFCIGQYGPHVRARVEAFLERNLINRNIASEDLGAYSREDANRYVGDYVFVRPDFMNPTFLWKMSVKIEWDSSVPGLRWKYAIDERRARTALVALPKQSSYVHFTYMWNGWCSLISTTLIDHNKSMYGCMFAMGDIIKKTSYMPMIVPVALRQSTRSKEQPVEIDTAHPEFNSLQDMLKISSGNHVKAIFRAYI